MSFHRVVSFGWTPLTSFAVSISWQLDALFARCVTS
jgi:hypothetical protein